MRNAIPSFIAISVLAAACGGEDPPQLVDAPIKEDAAPKQDAPPIDSPSFDFSCMGNAAPADGTAIDPLVLSGVATDFDVIQMAPVAVADAAVTSGGGAPAGNDTTDVAGAWSLSLASGTDPVEGFVEASKTGFRTVRLYPPSPMIASQDNIPMILLSNQTFALALQLASATQAPGNGTVGLVVADCANTPIEGAVPSITQGGNAVGTVFDGSLVQPGLFFVFDVPPGVTTVGATFNGMTLRAHDIDVVAAVTSTTGVRPGF